MGYYVLSSGKYESVKDPTEVKDKPVELSEVEINRDNILGMIENDSDYTEIEDENALTLELSDGSQYSRDINEVDYCLDKYFDCCHKGFEISHKLNEVKESGNLSAITSVMEEMYKYGIYCNEYLGTKVPMPGLEAIVSTPFNCLEAGIESVRGLVNNLFKAIAGIIKWLLGKIQSWMRKIIRMFSGLGRKVKKIRKNFKEFIKNNPKLKTLSDRNAQSFIEFINKKFKGLNRLTSEHVSKTPGIQGLGSTMVNLLEKEVNLLYPAIESLPLGNIQEFSRGLAGFYRGKDINNCKKAIKDSPEFAKHVLATQKIHANNDSVICKVISVDFNSVYFIAIGAQDITNFKPIIDKVAIDKVQLVVPDFKAEDANKMFNGKPVDWLTFTLKYMEENYKRIMVKPEKMIGEINKVKAEINKAYSKYKTSAGNKDVQQTTNLYLSFCKKLVTKYQEGVVKTCIESYKQLFEVANRLYSELIGSASIGKAESADKNNQALAKSNEDTDLHGGALKKGLQKVKKYADSNSEINNGTAKEGQKVGFFKQLIGADRRDFT